MKELKFRAWYKPDVEKGVFMKFVSERKEGEYYRFVHQTEEGCFEYDADIVLCDDNWLVEQWTGLKCDDGNDIYEGDIVAHYGDRMVVQFKEGAFVKVHDEEHYYPSSFLLKEGSRIFGNIHEHSSELKRDSK